MADNQLTKIKRTLPAIETGLRSSLTLSLLQTLQPHIQAVDSRVTAFTSDLTSKQTVFEQQMLNNQKATIDASFSQIRTDMTELIETRIGDRGRSLSESVDTKFAQLATTQAQQIDGAVNTRVTAQLAGLDSRIATAAAAQIPVLRVEIGPAVQLELQRANIAGQITAADDAITATLRQELNTAILNEISRAARSVDDAVRTLPGEVAVSERRASDDAVSRSGVAIAAQRSDLNSLSSRLTSEIGRIEIKVPPRTIVTNPVIIR